MNLCICAFSMFTKYREIDGEILRCANAGKQCAKVCCCKDVQVFVKIR